MATLFTHFYYTRKLVSINFLFFVFMRVYNYVFIFIKIKKRYVYLLTGLYGQKGLGLFGTCVYMCLLSPKLQVCILPGV